jgi:hypothetical protein
MGMNVGFQKCKERKELKWVKCIAGIDLRCIRRKHKVREFIRKNESRNYYKKLSETHALNIWMHCLNTEDGALLSMEV